MDSPGSAGAQAGQRACCALSKVSLDPQLMKAVPEAHRGDLPLRSAAALVWQQEIPVGLFHLFLPEIWASGSCVWEMLHHP